MANLSWARNAVLEAATRELVFEARATDPLKCPVNGGVFEATASRDGVTAPGGKIPKGGVTKPTEAA
jgi:hypothetical protein